MLRVFWMLCVAATFNRASCSSTTLSRSSAAFFDPILLINFGRTSQTKINQIGQFKVFK
jgi:hypothetical protein